MISVHEFRPGNFLLAKEGARIRPTPCTPDHLAMAARGEGATLFPMILKPELLAGCGFEENMDYALRPQAREFRLVLPVMGSADNSILAWVKSNGECFARAMVNGAVVSNNVHQLHQLQNLYYALVGTELPVKI